MTMLSTGSTYMPRGAAHPSYVINVLSNLVAECKAAGQESLTIEELEAAIKAYKP